MPRVALHGCRQYAAPLAFLRCVRHASAPFSFSSHLTRAPVCLHLCSDDNARLQGEVERAAQQQAELSSSVERLEAEAAESQKVGSWVPCC